MIPSVLLVEHHSDLRAEIAATLRRLHYTCDAVATPADAVLRLRDHAYSYVLVDVDSPDATAALLTSVADSRVVVISSVESTGDYATLRKPFDRGQLMAQLA